MTYSLEVQPEATEEVSEIYAYYESQSRGLGDQFLLALTACYVALQTNPFYQRRKDVFRHTMVRKFPYRVAFEITAQRVIVYQVRHTSRKPSMKFGP